ncbi:MAG: hypothetical protein RH949_11355 [Coleofasciculus sp. A1-SPW-01]|uniref:hypothetical protein n=1 Tax=Coleofasciculus sp. A1-SPW-01 TaxID=3070819 RepID=UPI0032F8D47B
MTDGISRYPPTGYLRYATIEPVAPRDFGGVVFVGASNPEYPILRRSQIELVNNRRHCPPYQEGLMELETREINGNGCASGVGCVMIDSIIPCQPFQQIATSESVAVMARCDALLSHSIQHPYAV